MNYSKAILLINPGVRAVVGTYEHQEPGAKDVPRQIYKTTDASIQVGDLVNVPSTTRHKVTVNRIVAVDVDVNFDTPEELPWIIGRLDMRPFEQTLAMEADAIAKIRSAETRRRREELANTLMRDNPELADLRNVALPGTLEAESK